MHELSLGRDIVAALKTAAAGHGYRRIHRAQVGVGSLRDMDGATLRACLDMVAPGSIAEGAELDIAERLAAAHCYNCDTEVLVRRRADVCPCCGSFRLQVKTGHEVVVLACEGD